MILLDGEKFACVNCIRGHRSSTCKHQNRPLVKVRTRGRPALNSGHRVAVTEAIPVHQTETSTSGGSTSANSSTTSVSSVSETPTTKEEASATDDSVKVEVKSCCGSTRLSTPTPPKNPSCCSSSGHLSTVKTDVVKCTSCASLKICTCAGNSNTILMKSTKRVYVDMKGGQLNYVGPYTEKSMNNFKFDVHGTEAKRLKHNPGPCCPSRNMDIKTHNDHSNVSQFKVFKTVLVNEVNPAGLSSTSQNQFIPIQPKQSISQPTLSQEPDTANSQHLTYPQASHTNDFNSDFYQLDTTAQSVPPQQLNLQHATQSAFQMVVPDGCTTECNCGPDCQCGTCLVHRSYEELRSIGLVFQTSSEQESDVSREGTPDVNDSINFKITDELFIDDCQCPEDACHCENCIKHGIIGGVKMPSNGGAGHPTSFNMEQFDLPQSLIDQGHDCGCLPEECECFDCPKHGIVNGVRGGPTF